MTQSTTSSVAPGTPAQRSPLEAQLAATEQQLQEELARNWFLKETLRRIEHHLSHLIGHDSLRQRLWVTESRLQAFLRSRIYRVLWALRVLKRPQWIREYAQSGTPGTQDEQPQTTDALNEVAYWLRRGQEHGDDMDRLLHHLSRKGFTPTVILDVGAAKGYWSVRAQRVFRTAEFYMIDPLAESEASLRQACQRDPRLHYLLLAVGRQRGTVAMDVSEDCDGSYIVPNADGSLKSVRQVPVERLDDLLAEGRIKQPNLLKMDVQGFEKEVLLGAENVLKSAQVVIIEVNMFEFVPGMPLAQEIIAMMVQRGFRLYDLAGTLRRPYDDALGQMDLVFVASSSNLVSSNRWK